MLVLCRAQVSARAGLAREEHAVFCRYSDLVLAVATTSEMFCTACGHMNAGEGKEKDLSSRNVMCGRSRHEVTYVLHLCWQLTVQAVQYKYNQKPMLANKDGIWNIGHICLCHLSVKILCTNLRDIWIKCKRVMSKKVFYISRPPGGAVRSWCEKCRGKVSRWPLGSVHTKFDAERCSWR